MNKEEERMVARLDRAYVPYWKRQEEEGAARVLGLLDRLDRLSGRGQDVCQEEGSRTRHL